jgi:hypothetical protein
VDGSKRKVENDIAKNHLCPKDDQWKSVLAEIDLKWHAYKPQPILKHLLDFIRLIER